MEKIEERTSHLLITRSLSKKQQQEEKQKEEEGHYDDEGFVQVVRVHDGVDGVLVFGKQVDDKVADLLSDGVVSKQRILFCFLHLLSPLLALLSSRIGREAFVAHVQRH